MCGFVFIQFCAVASKRRIFSAPECVLAIQGRSGSSKVDDFGTNFDYGAILHCFSDTATYWLKTACFLPLSQMAPSLSMFHLEFCGEVKREETRVMGLSSSEDPMIVARVVLTQCQCVTDRQMDGFTIANKKLSCRRETARQLSTWRGLGPPAHPPLATPMRMVESKTRNKRRSSMPSIECTLR